MQELSQPSADATQCGTRCNDCDSHFSIKVFQHSCSRLVTNKLISALFAWSLDWKPLIRSSPLKQASSQFIHSYQQLQISLDSPIWLQFNFSSILFFNLSSAAITCSGFRKIVPIFHFRTGNDQRVLFSHKTNLQLTVSISRKLHYFNHCSSISILHI